MQIVTQGRELQIPLNASSSSVPSRQMIKHMQPVSMVWFGAPIRHGRSYFCCSK